MAETPTQTPFIPRDMGGHKVPEKSAALDYPTPLEPLQDVGELQRLSAADQARTIVAGDNVCTLASLTVDGDPWASVIQYAVLDDGSPVFSLSKLALHGRNLAADPRASIALAGPVPEGHDPGDSGRVTLAGKVIEPEGEQLELAQRAYFDAIPWSETYTAFGDFTLYVLDIEKVRWVGGFGRMNSSTPEQYKAGEVDPTAKHADYAVKHMNEDHADALLEMAKAFSGHTDATSATARRAAREGRGRARETERGKTPGR
ncbi:MAG: pyridoxamine 5'-phosphate oxidase family protein, partial [Solirubrobacterales bacterium]